MKIFSISDIHASTRNKGNYAFLLGFLNKCLKEAELDYVIFLGDIFDHMVGNHVEYFNLYKEYFLLLDKLVKKTKVIFIEGNHDFHLESLFTQRYKNKIKYIEEVLLLNDRERRLCFIHGDLIDYQDLNYKCFRKFIRSNFFKLFSSNFLKFREVEKIGEFSTKDSKRYWISSKKINEIKNKYRKFSQKYRLNLKFDYLIIGHCHVKDNYQAENFKMINNGYSGRELVFIKYENGDLSFESV